MRRFHVTAVLLSLVALLAVATIHVTHAPTARAASCIPDHTHTLVNGSTPAPFAGALLHTWIEEVVDRDGFRCGGIRAGADYTYGGSACGHITWAGPGTYLKLLKGTNPETNLAPVVYPNKGSTCIGPDNFYYTSWSSYSGCGVWVYGIWGDYSGQQSTSRNTQICV
jgi:hypothetical protein